MKSLSNHELERKEGREVKLNQSPAVFYNSKMPKAEMTKGTNDITAGWDARAALSGKCMF